MNEEQMVIAGWYYAKGAIKYICTIIFWIVLVAIALNGIRWMTGWGMDSTDKSGFDRSGLKIHVDNLTGIHYLSNQKGGMVVRLNRNGEVFKEPRP